MPHTILASKSHPLGGFFLARQDDGAFLAGRTEADAKPFPTAQDVFDRYKPLADQGSHWAWNLCYAVQEHIA